MDFLSSICLNNNWEMPSWNSPASLMDTTCLGNLFAHITHLTRLEDNFPVDAFCSRAGCTAYRAPTVPGLAHFLFFCCFVYMKIITAHVLFITWQFIVSNLNMLCNIVNTTVLRNTTTSDIFCHVLKFRVINCGKILRRLICFWIGGEKISLMLERYLDLPRPCLWITLIQHLFFFLVEKPLKIRRHAPVLFQFCVEDKILVTHYYPSCT
jgi:hypothetical protein